MGEIFQICPLFIKTNVIPYKGYFLQKYFKQKRGKIVNFFKYLNMILPKHTKRK